MTSHLSDINTVIRRIISDTEILTPEQEADLVDRWCNKGELKARNELVLAHGKLVASMASQFANRGIDFSDLVNEGFFALSIAANKFDLGRKNRFSTYASWWVFSRMQEAVQGQLYNVKIGRTRHERKALNLLATARQILGPNIDPNTYADIAEISKCPVEMVRRIDAAISSKSMSLNATVSQDNNSGEMGDFIEDEDKRDHAQISIQTRGQRNVLEDALSKLKDSRAAKILRDRYLNTHDSGERALKDIALDLDISSERVRQIERDALIDLKNILEKSGQTLDNLFY